MITDLGNSDFYDVNRCFNN